ncbi:MAG: type I-G CRISPR-associated protein Csb2 [Acidimicrobiales bacterium]
MLVLDVSWLTAAYEAEIDGRAEWPPHPARAFAALVSVAEAGSADDDALRWFEGQPPPVVRAPPAAPSQRRAFVVTNTVESSGGHQTYLGRTSGGRSWHRSLPSSPAVRFVWPDADPEPQLLAQLDDLARRVPYLGRSTSPALLAFSATEPPLDDSFRTYTPDPSGSERLRSPRRGLLDQLREAFADPFSDRPLVRPTTYRGPNDAAPVAVDGPIGNRAWSHLVTLSIDGGGVDGRQAVVVAAAFKRALLSRMGDGLPPDSLQLLHGHYDHRVDNRRQCAVVALPFVGNRHATGAVLGLGVAVSVNLEAEVFTSLLRLLGFDRPPEEAPRLSQLRVGPHLTVTLGRAASHWTVDPGRWVRAARRWDTVFPIVLDRYPRRSYTAADAVADGCEWAGFDRPVRVDVWPSSRVAGAPHVSSAALRRPDEPPRPAVHATLHFARPVCGPVIVGHLRHCGLGLCVPADGGADGPAV